MSGHNGLLFNGRDTSLLRRVWVETGRAVLSEHDPGVRPGKAAPAPLAVLGDRIDADTQCRDQQAESDWVDQVGSRTGPALPRFPVGVFGSLVIFS